MANYNYVKAELYQYHNLQPDIASSSFYHIDPTSYQ